MRKVVLILLLSLTYTAIEAQIVKVSAGTSFSVIKVPQVLPGISNTTDNAVAGFSGVIGVDFAESKWAFLTGSVGIVQKGRRDAFNRTDALGNTIPGQVKHKVLYTFGVVNLAVNFKLRNDGLIPYFSIGPRIDHLMNENSGFDKTAIGFNGGFGLTKRMESLELGGRLDYLHSFGENPKTIAGSAMLFFGFKLGK